VAFVPEEIFLLAHFTDFISSSPQKAFEKGIHFVEETPAISRHRLELQCGGLLQAEPFIMNPTEYQ